MRGWPFGGLRERQLLKRSKKERWEAAGLVFHEAFMKTEPAWEYAIIPGKHTVLRKIGGF